MIALAMFAGESSNAQLKPSVFGVGVSFLVLCAVCFLLLNQVTHYQCSLSAHHWLTVDQTVVHDWQHYPEQLKCGLCVRL